VISKIILLVIASITLLTTSIYASVELECRHIDEGEFVKDFTAVLNLDAGVASHTENSVRYLGVNGNGRIRSSPTEISYSIYYDHYGLERAYFFINRVDMSFVTNICYEGCRVLHYSGSGQCSKIETVRAF